MNMLRSLVRTHQSVVKATDFEAGTIDSFLFNDRNWVVRYLVVDTKRWFSGNKVLVSPVAIKDFDWTRRTLEVYLSKEQVKNSPDIDTDKPISLMMEENYARHYNWPVYWRPPMAPPPGASPLDDAPEEAENSADSHLRSTLEVIGYEVRAREGVVGFVEDFIVDEDSWIIRYIVVGIGKWKPSKLVLVSPVWVADIVWERSQMQLELAKEALEGSPEYDPDALVNRETENVLYDFHGKPKYWEDEGGGR